MLSKDISAASQVLPIWRYLSYYFCNLILLDHRPWFIYICINMICCTDQHTVLLSFLWTQILLMSFKMWKHYPILQSFINLLTPICGKSGSYSLSCFFLSISSQKRVLKIRFNLCLLNILGICPWWNQRITLL